MQIIDACKCHILHTVATPVACLVGAHRKMFKQDLVQFDVAWVVCVGLWNGVGRSSRENFVHVSFTFTLVVWREFSADVLFPRVNYLLFCLSSDSDNKILGFWRRGLARTNHQYLIEMANRSRFRVRLHPSISTRHHCHIQTPIPYCDNAWLVPFRSANGLCAVGNSGWWCACMKPCNGPGKWVEHSSTSWRARVLDCIITMVRQQCAAIRNYEQKCISIQFAMQQNVFGPTKCKLKRPAKPLALNENFIYWTYVA